MVNVVQHDTREVKRCTRNFNLDVPQKPMDIRSQ